MRWHILGAGAMGCLWAARIQQNSGNATLLLRNEAQVNAYATAPGLLLESHSATTLVGVPAVSVKGCEALVTHLLVATKAQDVEAALGSVSALLTPATHIVLLQNGLKTQREVSATLGSQRVWCLSTSHGAWMRGPFHVVEAGLGEAWLGRIHCADSADADLLANLPADEMQIRLDTDIEQRLWHKLAANCAINALSALHDCRNGELLILPAARAELFALCAEIGAILAGIPDAPNLSDLQGQVAAILTATAYNYSSTLQDIRHRRRPEIDHLNGYLCELAQRHGLDYSLNQEILRRFHALCREKGID